MTTSDKKKVLLLVLLVALAGVSWFFVFRPIMTTASSSNPVVKAVRKPTTIKPDQAVVIDLPRLQQPSVGDIGRRNLFQFPPKQPPKPTVSSMPAPPPGFQISQVPPPTIISAPPAPPFKSFKYEGVSVNRASGKILGALSEGGNTYQVREGDCLMGQYCITRLTEAAVEIEDVQQKRRQEFRRVVQQ
jgi:hypothetical protein